MKSIIRKKVILVCLLLGLLMTAMLTMGNTGCDSAADKERKVVDNQQKIYADSQPVPFFNRSLARGLWIDFYRAQNTARATYSQINDMYGNLRFSTPSMGYPIPYDTQLTDPTQRVDGGAVIDQAEPNGLFTSKNSDATIVFANNDDGTVSPIYSELKVTCFPFPVKWVNDHWERVKEAEPSIKLTPVDGEEGDPKDHTS